MKPIEWLFPVALYILCFRKYFQLLSLRMKSFSQSDRLTKSYRTLLSSGTPYADFQGDSRLRVCGSNIYSTLLKCCSLCYKPTEQYFPIVLSTPFLQGGANIKSVNEISEVVIQTKATARTKNWHVPPPPPQPH